MSGNGNRWKPAGVNLWLRELGIYRAALGCRSEFRTAVFRLSNRQVALFLRHLWATDGTISPRKPGQRGSHGVHFSTCSRGLADDVAALLLRLGIVARIQTVTSGYRNPVHMVWVHGVEKQTAFLDTVGSFRAAGCSRLSGYSPRWSECKANTNVDTVPEEMLWRVQFLMQQQGISRSRMAAGNGQAIAQLWLTARRVNLMAEYAPHSE